MVRWVFRVFFKRQDAQRLIKVVFSNESTFIKPNWSARRRLGVEEFNVLQSLLEEGDQER